LYKPWYKHPGVVGIVLGLGTWFSAALVRAHYVLAAVLLA